MDRMTVSWEHSKSALLSLEAKVKCKICGKLPDDPHLLWCKHSYCKECILKLPQCPECDYPVKPQELVRNIMLGHLLNAMKLSSEIMISNTQPNINDAGIELRVEKKSSVTAETQINNKEDETKKINDEQKPVVKHHSTSKLKMGLSNKKETLPLRKQPRRQIIGSGKKKDDKIYTQDQLKRRVLKSSTKIVCNDQDKAEQCNKSKAITLKQRAKRSSHASEKSSEEEYGKTLKNSGITSDSSVKSKKDEFKTPKSKSKSSPSSSTPKSSILFSAKKIQPLNKINIKGETPLQIACRQGKLVLVQKLLEEGAEPNVKDYANWTPLCDAVGSGNVEVVKALLVAGAGVNTPSNLNTTALVEAVVRKNTAMVRLLMSYGADMHQRTALNNTALSIADDEMKSLMMSVANVPVQSYPAVKSSTRAILADKLSLQHIDQLMTLCQKFNLTLSTAFMEDISHIVVEKTEGNLCHGSVAVMMGILSGCLVVSTDWVTSCLAENDLLPVDGFEPKGTDKHPNTDVFLRARLNQQHLLPRLFDGCHISLQHDQSWPESHKRDLVALIQAAGAVYQPRQCDAERIPSYEQTVMFHAHTSSPLALVSHIILYQPGALEPLLKYNMAHVKTYSVSWFLQCIQTFNLNV